MYVFRGGGLCTKDGSGVSTWARPVVALGDLYHRLTLVVGINES